jgi:hypothetical protein
VVFDSKAAAFLGRAYAVKGAWAGDYLPPPGPRARLWMFTQGIDPYEVDRWGELRFIRAYKRSVFWVLNWYGGVSGLRGERNLPKQSGGWHAPVRGEWQTGVRNDAGAWAVRLRLHPDGKGGGRSETSRRGRQLGNALGNRWIDDDGHPTFRQSTPDERS